MNLEALIRQVIISAIPIIFAITVHESAHAYAARRFGDATAFMLGRQTLNPLKHIDPFGSIILPLICMLFGGFVFGWAKPVPINFSALRKPKRDMIFVSAAGPISNLVMALIWALIYKISLSIGSVDIATPLRVMSVVGIQINISLMALNLLPLLPLDGGRILEGLLPQKLAYKYSRSEPYGLYILMFLLVTKVLGYLMLPVVFFGYFVVSSLFSF